MTSILVYLLPGVFIFALFSTLVYAFIKRSRIRAWVTSIESKGYTRLSLPRPYTHWYVQNEDQPTYFLVVEKVRNYSAAGERSVPDLGLAAYIPLSTSHTPTDIIDRCLQTTNMVTRALHQFLELIGRVIPHVFKRPSIILASGHRFTVFSPEVLPASLVSKLPRLTCVLRIGFSWNHSPDSIDRSCKEFRELIENDVS